MKGLLSDPWKSRRSAWSMAHCSQREASDRTCLVCVLHNHFNHVSSAVAVSHTHGLIRAILLACSTRCNTFLLRRSEATVPEPWSASHMLDGGSNAALVVNPPPVDSSPSCPVNFKASSSSQEEHQDPLLTFSGGWKILFAPEWLDSFSLHLLMSSPLVLPTSLHSALLAHEALKLQNTVLAHWLWPFTS